jgi:hypothetical protein
MGKFDDKGILSPNKYRKGNDKAPTHTGIIDIGRETLKQLLVNMKDSGEAKLQIAGWRKTDKPDMLSLKVSIPQEREEGSRGGGRSRSRDDDDYDSRDRSRGSARRDDDDRGRSRKRDEEEDYDNEPPFEDRRSSRRSNRRDDEYGGEDEL